MRSLYVFLNAATHLCCCKSVVAGSVKGCLSPFWPQTRSQSYSSSRKGLIGPGASFVIPAGTFYSVMHTAPLKKQRLYFCQSKSSSFPWESGLESSALIYIWHPTCFYMKQENCSYRSNLSSNEITWYFNSHTSFVILIKPIMQFELSKKLNCYAF